MKVISKMFKLFKKAVSQCEPVILKNEWTVGEYIILKNLMINLDLQFLQINGNDFQRSIHPQLRSH